MKKTFPICLILALTILLGTLAVPAAADVTGASCQSLQAAIALDSSGKQLDTAKAVILYELNTDTLVYSYQADMLIDPTGLVKILTVLVALENGNLNDTVTVHQSTLNTVAVGSVSAKLKSGEEISLRDLLYCIMVSSANDACAVVAAHIGGDQAGFVELMNAKARQLGCVASNFANPHGLTNDNQVSTARDLAIITKAALENPKFREMFGLTTYTVAATNKSEERNLKTTNNMMRDTLSNYDSRVTGGKPAAATTTDRSMICTAQVGTANYLCVVISAKGIASEDGLSIVRYGIFEEMSALLDYAEKGFEIRQILDESQALYQYAVAGGENAVVLRPAADLSVVLPKNFDADKLYVSHIADMSQMTAPIAQSQRLGQVSVTYGTLLLGSCDLMAMHAVAQTGASILPAERLELAEDAQTALGKTLQSYAAFILLGIVAVVLLIAAIVRAIQNGRYRRDQRRRERNHKRSR